LDITLSVDEKEDDVEIDVPVAMWVSSIPYLYAFPIVNQNDYNCRTLITAIPVVALERNYLVWDSLKSSELGHGSGGLWYRELPNDGFQHDRICIND